jgi:hypothetical protein
MNCFIPISIIKLANMALGRRLAPSNIDLNLDRLDLIMDVDEKAPFHSKLNYAQQFCVFE